MSKPLLLLAASCLALFGQGCGNRAGESLAVKHAQETAQREESKAEAASILRRGDDLQAVVDQVLKAHGGKERLAQWKMGYLKYKFQGELGPVPGAEVLVEETYELPDRLRRVMSLRVGKKVDSTIFLKDGDQRQVFQPDSPKPASKSPDRSQEERPLSIAFDMALLSNPGARRELKGQKYVQGRAALAVNISGKGFPPFTAYFDRETALLAKEEKRLMVIGPEEARLIETYYEDYQERSGVKFPVRTVTMYQGEPVIETTLLEAKPLLKVDRSIFQKP